MMAVMTSGERKSTMNSSTLHCQDTETRTFCSFHFLPEHGGNIAPQNINIWRIVLTTACHAVTLNADIRQQTYCMSHKNIFEA